MLLRETLARLTKHPLISEIKLGRRHGVPVFDVHFSDGITEHWYLYASAIPKHNFSFVVADGQPLFTGFAPNTYGEFETNPLEDDFEELKSFFMVSRHDISKAGFCEIRLKVHEIINELLTLGWQRFRYPESALLKDFESVKNVSLQLYWEANHRLTMYKPKRREPGTLLLSHFNDIGHMKYKDRLTLAESWQPVPLFHAINYSLRVGKNITYASLVRVLTAILPDGFWIAGPRLPNVCIWKAIFTKLGLKSVIDWEPNCGEKAIAAAACGINYTGKDIREEVKELSGFLRLAGANAGTQILTGTQPVSDEELATRLATTGPRIAVITKDQVKKFVPAEQFEIRTEPHHMGKILHVVAFYK